MQEECPKDAAPVKKPFKNWSQWKKKNQEIRETLGIDGLGAYKPPYLADGSYTYEIVPELEKKYNCSIQILTLNPDQDKIWEVRVNGQTVALTERYRNEKGNSIYGIHSETFIKAIRNEAAE